MSQRGHQHEESWTGGNHERLYDPLEQRRPHQSSASSPRSQSQSDFRYHPYPPSSSRSSLQYADQSYPSAYINQELRYEKSTYDERELRPAASRLTYTHDPSYGMEMHQPRPTHFYDSSLVDIPQSSMRRPNSPRYEEPLPEQRGHGSPSPLIYERAHPYAKPSLSHSQWSAEQFDKRTSSELVSYTSRPRSHHASSTSQEHTHEKPRIDAPYSKPHYTQRRSTQRDEFDGPAQYLPRPPPSTNAATTSSPVLPTVPMTLNPTEQDSILTEVNARLSHCAYTFFAKHKFPIPLEAGKPRVSSPSDREWAEWAYLLKRLATKRRIPARILFEGQIKQLVTVIENSLEMKTGASDGGRGVTKPLRDDWNVLQLISAAVQVAKLLVDGETMAGLEELYRSTEAVILERRGEGEREESEQKGKGKGAIEEE